MSDQQYWLGFSLVSEIGPKRLGRLLDQFGDIASAWYASEPELRHAGLDERPTANLIAKRAQLDLEAQLAKVHRIGAKLLTLADDDYPPLLRQVENAPTVLYVKGALKPEDELALAIVGTRKASNYGAQAAYKFAQQLVSNGITIISGLAQGIDTAAHKGALDGGGRTVAVIGCGLDIVYPRENQKLHDAIIENGAVISEFPIGTPPDARNFPQRNRVISGMALGVLVAEAPERSGAIITATAAAEQGREVFAIPGNIFNKASGGTNRLIQDGAKLVMKVEDILAELNIAHDTIQTRIKTERIMPVSEDEKRLMQQLTADPIHIDDLVRLCGLPIQTIHSTLTMLELKGLARNVGHMQYSRVH